MQNKQLKQIQSELKTLRDMLRWCVTEFNKADLYFGHGTDNAWDEAITLIMYVLKIPHDLLEQVIDTNLTSAEKEAIYNIAQQRINQRSPLPYITNEAWFAGLPFYVNEKVIIPRSPIAELIEQAFSPWIEFEKVTSILDLCCGSGCIAIACAYVFPEANIDAVDIDDAALEIAKINVSKHQLQAQVNLLKSDLFQNLNHKKYDIIVSNPPYVDAEDMQSLPKEFTHEPKHALAAGKDGLECVKSILVKADEHLTEQGILIVEVGNSWQALESIYPRVPFTWLEFERGGHGVFLLSKQEIQQHLQEFNEYVRK